MRVLRTPRGPSTGSITVPTTPTQQESCTISSAWNPSRPSTSRYRVDGKSNGFWWGGNQTRKLRPEVNSIKVHGVISARVVPVKLLWSGLSSFVRSSHSSSVITRVFQLTMKCIYALVWRCAIVLTSVRPEVFLSPSYSLTRSTVCLGQVTWSAKPSGL